MKSHQGMFEKMREATRNLLSKGPAAATASIQNALAGLGSGQKARAASQAHPLRDINPAPASQAPRQAAPKTAPGSVPPATARPARSAPSQSTSGTPSGFSAPAAAPDAPFAFSPPPVTPTSPFAFNAPPITPTSPFAFNPPPVTGAGAQEFVKELLAGLGVQNGPGTGTLGPDSFDLPGSGAPPAAAPGRFIAASYSNHAGSRDYKLYVPGTWHGQTMPLLVMLHGCTQSPDDFAAGTQMNAVAEEKQCFVVYPAQAKGANSSKCWNWFNALDQKRDQGEPSIIAGIARQIMADYPVDQRQVFIAGLSAGGAMAVIAGTLYPELFAAVGVHSGLPFASAQDLPSALAAMRSGAAPGTARKNKDGGIPIIVFHGDRDTTVNPRNGEQLMAQGLRSQSGGKAAPQATVHSGNVPNGHRYTQTTHLQPDGSPLGEHWVIHGAGHAWSGGSAHGSYTDSKGPDASREMMRFFKTVH